MAAKLWTRIHRGLSRFTGLQTYTLHQYSTYTSGEGGEKAPFSIAEGWNRIRDLGGLGGNIYRLCMGGRDYQMLLISA